MTAQQQDNNPRGVLTGIMITLFSALFSTLFFAAFFMLAYAKKMPYGKPQAMVLQITSILFAVALTQVLSKKIQGNKLSLMQGFLGGWMASLVLAIFVSTFYSIFSKVTGNQLVPKGALTMLVMLYSGIGIFISLILAIILKKE